MEKQNHSIALSGTSSLRGRLRLAAQAWRTIALALDQDSHTHLTEAVTHLRTDVANLRARLDILESETRNEPGVT